jgi:hypothetical protein
MASIDDEFSSDVTDLPGAGDTQLAQLQRGDRFALTVEPVVKSVAGTAVRMLG